MANVFQKQKEALISELRTFVIAKAQSSQEKHISCLEKKIENQVKCFLENSALNFKLAINF